MEIGKAFGSPAYMMKKIHLPLAALALGLIMSAHTCNEKAGKTAGNGLAQGKWVLEQLNGKRVEMPGDKENPYLTVDSLAENVSGFAGCNRMFGPIRVWGDSISFANLAATRMYCVETQHIEDEFMKALNEASTFTLKDGQLTLRNGTDLAVFRKQD